MRKIAILFSLMALMFPASGFAADPALPEPLKELVKQGSEIRYLGNDGGLEGWVTFREGREQYFYVTPDHQSIILGVLYNNKGDVITAQQINKLRKNDPAVDTLANATPDTASPPPPAAAPAAAQPTTAPAAVEEKAPEQKTSEKAPSKSQQLYADMESAAWVSVGQKTAPIVYAIIDPQCPHCHDMIQDIRKSGYLEKGAIQLRLIPVGLMNENSLTMAANLLTDENPAAALFKQMDGDKTVLMKNPSPNTQAVQGNIEMMQTWKIDVTPYNVYKNKKGQVIIMRGRPNDLKALIADLK